MSDLAGLPPQVRGARIPAISAVQNTGLTPAGAGSTLTYRTRSRLWGAYPRRCGEHRYALAMFTGADGLPPQVRGARPVHPEHDRRSGLTPAGAGSTSVG